MLLNPPQEVILTLKQDGTVVAKFNDIQAKEEDLNVKPIDVSPYDSIVWMSSYVVTFFKASDGVTIKGCIKTAGGQWIW